MGPNLRGNDIYSGDCVLCEGMTDSQKNLFEKILRHNNTYDRIHDLCVLTFLGALVYEKNINLNLGIYSFCRNG